MNAGRWSPALAVAAALGWLQLEDNSVIAPVVLGAAFAALWTARIGRGAGGASGWALRGGLLGAGTALGGAILMLLKSGLHSHVFPDYPPGHILALVARMPAWALAGALAGVGVWLWRRAARQPQLR